jgi:hypothetical protein
VLDERPHLLDPPVDLRQVPRLCAGMDPVIAGTIAKDRITETVGRVTGPGRLGQTLARSPRLCPELVARQGHVELGGVVKPVGERHGLVGQRTATAPLSAVGHLGQGREEQGALLRLPLVQRREGRFEDCGALEISFGHATHCCVEHMFDAAVDIGRLVTQHAGRVV